jgi:serine/threonine protein kinase
MAAVEKVTASEPSRMIGRYALFDEVGRGGTATVHIGRLVGPVGFSRTVAIKRMHESVARDAGVAAMFLDEARLAGRIQHTNVVSTLDVLAMDGEAFLIMEYLHGESLASLLSALRGRHESVPVRTAVQIVRDALHGLHAAHEAKNEQGESLDLVHRDVSPHNILVGVDGIARVLDFGIAKAIGRIQDTHTGQLKGKLSYMAPEQILGHVLDRRVDIFAAGLVLWEALAGRRPFDSESSGHVMYRVLHEDLPSLPGVPAAIAAAMAKATDRDPARRFASALEFARALEEASEPLAPSVIGDWVRLVGGAALARRHTRLQEIESTRIELSEVSLDRRGRSSRPPGPARSELLEEDATQSEQFDSRMAESHFRPKNSRFPRSRLAIGLAAGALSIGLVLAEARGRSSAPRNWNAVAAPPGSRPAAPAEPVAAPTSSPSPVEITAHVQAKEKSEPAARPRNGGPSPSVRRTAPKAPAVRLPVRRPEDLFSRE